MIEHNIPGLWAAGDAITGLVGTCCQPYVAEVVVNNMTGRKDQMRYDSMPAVVYTSPAAVVGLTKEEVEDRGIKVKVGRILHGDQCSLHR